MSKHLPVPAELQHLIEKRDRDRDRREREHRADADRRAADLGPLGAIESASSLDAVPTEERRNVPERRRSSERRKKRRRKREG